MLRKKELGGFFLQRRIPNSGLLHSQKKGSNSSLLKTILSPYLTSFSRDIPLWEAPAYILANIVAVHLHFADGTKTK